ncbi:Crp/Fnr family transcriptional regulator [uncultured Enterovirga sp.]|uniref:Crp/Fnr family transcriptional regulator n=1 Tax=uncultured Enterovirga sp. TaxID=2026352 RepID=UPI0035C9F15C
MLTTTNRLLKALPVRIQADLSGEFEVVTLSPGQVLQEPFAPYRHTYFPNDGVISVMASSGLGEGEIGMVGREGMTSLPLLFESDRSPNRAVVQVAGEALRVPSATLLRDIGAKAELRSVLLRFGQCWMTQISQTSLANARNTVRERLARWLVMCQDRVESDQVLITHEALAVVLGVRRPGVTVATHELEGDGAIRAKRGCIRILDRSKLEIAANGSYGCAEREYERLLGERDRVQAQRPNGHGLQLQGVA